MNTENKFNDRLIRLPELEQIFGACKRTVRRRAENGEGHRHGARHHSLAGSAGSGI
jgi:hypothetical protein